MEERELKPPLSLSGHLSAYFSLAEKTVRTKITYRAAMLFTLTANMIGYCVFLLVWVEIYKGNPESGLIPKQQMFSYLVCAFILNFILMLSVELRFGMRLKMGLITGDLIKPMPFFAFQMAQAVGDALTNIIVVSPIFVLALWGFDINILPANLFSLFAGLLSLALAFWVQFNICFLIVQGTFLLQSFYGIFFVRISMHQVFSGLSAPLILFPEVLQKVAVFLPFKSVIQTPCMIWLGQAPAGQVGYLLLEQFVWGAGLLIFSSRFFSFAVSKHQIQGG